MDRWERVGREVSQARRRRGWTQRQLARLASVHAQTISRLERGAQATYSEDTIVGVELALSWEHGSIEAIGKGGKPTQAPDHLDAVVRMWRQLSPRDQATVRKLVEDLANR